LNWDNIITRIIDTPVMNKKELKSFIENNIEEYFAVSMNEYCYDYEIMSIDKQDKKGKMSIMLVVVPKVKLKEILEFIKYCGLTPKSVGIYPDYISNLFLAENDSSIAVIDTNSGKSTLTILDKENIFLYSNISGENYERDEEEFSDILENLDYFLNFYSTRHFGNKVDKVYILGEFYNNRNLYKLISNQTSIETMQGLNSKLLKSIKNGSIDGNIYADILGYSVPTKNVYGKKIDFEDKLYRKDKKEKSDNKLIIIELAILSLITAIVVATVFIYTKVNLSKYNTADIDAQIAVLSNVQKDIDKLDQEKKEYEDKVKDIQKIENDEFDYIGLLDILRKGLPKDVSIKTITIDKDNVNVTFSINSSTIDAARIIIAINKMNIFEPIELPQINLNDDVKEVNLNLKIIKSYKGVDTSGKK
jgi:Fimbrial assembly protein (PilN).